MTSATQWQWWRLVLSSLSSLLISSSRAVFVRLCLCLCSGSDKWVTLTAGALGSRTSTHPTEWCLHAAAFYDRLARRMCLCRVALSCSHCDVVKQSLQIRRIGYRSTVALSSPMLHITADVPVSDVRHHYRSDTSSQWRQHLKRCILRWRQRQ